MDIQNLDDYSKRFAKIFFAAFSDWEKFASAQQIAETNNFSLVIRIPSPVKGLISEDIVSPNEDYLSVYCDDEITVAYDFHHVHFDSYSDANELEEFNGAIEYIKEIINEEICMIAIFADKNFCGSVSANTNKILDLSFWTWLDKSVCKDVFIRSWRGNYNGKFDIEDVMDGKIKILQM